MKPLFTEEEFQNTKSTDKLACQCYYCGNKFYRVKKDIANAMRDYHHIQAKYCSIQCNANAHKKSKEVECANCGTQFIKRLPDIKRSKSGNHFCSRSCAATYNNKNKTHGTRRSKLEIWLEDQLNKYYPELDILFNDKETIGSELDIYIPSLNVAFELNGIFHYEPIYGNDKLQKIQENDQSKSKACHDSKIDLCVIDTSQQKYVKPKTSQKYLDIITTIINQRTLLNSQSTLRLCNNHHVQVV